MELRHLRYFIRAAELLNFTKAAESLYVSQPTLSVQIHQLEQELGAELFSRVGRNVRLTQAGEVFLSRARQAVVELEEGAKEVDGLTGLIRGTLSIAALPLIGSKLVPGWVSTFKERYPNVRMHIRTGTSDDIEARLLAGTIDMGIATAPNHPDLSWSELFKDETVLLASKRHPLAARKAVAIDELRNVPMVTPSERISPSLSLGKFFEQFGIEPNIEMTYDDGHALIELIKKDKYITFLPQWAAIGETEICIISLPPPGIQIIAGALWHHLSPASKAFLEVMKEQVALMPSSAAATR
jgi:LysR family cyn operon transcriptional activator